MVHEQIQSIRKKELVFVFIMAVIISMLIFVGTLLFSPSIALIFSLALLVLGMNLSVYLIKKFGIATLFYVTISILTYKVTDIGIFGWKKVICFLIAAFIFEVIFLLLKLHLHNIPLDMILGTSLSTASILLIAAFLLSSGLASSFPLGLINFILLGFAVGLVSSVITFLIWHNIERTKFIIRLESYLMSLSK